MSAAADAAAPSAGPQPPTSSAPLVAALAACAVAAAWVAAQGLAARYGYAAWLGRPALPSTPATVLGWRLVAVGGAGAALFVLLRVGRARAWGPGLALGLALTAGVGLAGARGPLYGPLQGVTWAVRLHALAPKPARPGAPADPTLPPGAVRGASGRIYYPRRDPRAPVPLVVPPAVAAQAGAAVQAYVRTFAVAFLGLLTAVLVARPPRRRRAPTTSHGSASWGDPRDLCTALTPGPALGNATGEPLGLLLGRPLDDVPRARWPGARGPRAPRAAAQGGGQGGEAPPALDVVRFRGEGHLITIAPNRTGKGVSAIVPNLLVYPGSVVVSDPKGENYTLTQRRRRAAGQHVWALDPFGITAAVAHQDGEPGMLNPLDFIDARSDDAHDDAAMLADMLVVTQDGGGSGNEGFFDDEARALLGTLILYVAATEPRGARRSLPRVRELVTLAPEDFTKLLGAMRACGTAEGAERLGHAGTLIARGAARLLSKADKERSGVLSTAQRHTHFLDSRRMAAVLERTSIPLETLREGRLSLYLVLPTERLSTYRPWMRLMLGVCLRVMVHQGAGQALGAPYQKMRVLFPLDEFANLKRLAPVEDAFTIAAGYGVTFWLFLQDLSQLKAQYPRSWGTFLANADVLQTFGTNDLETAKLLSELTGDATILVEGESLSASRSHGKQGSRQEGSSQSLSEKGRRLLTPDEVRRLPPDEALVFLRGRSALRVRKLHYARDAVFAGLYDTPALAAPEAVAPEAAAEADDPRDDGDPAGAPPDARPVPAASAAP